MHLKYISRPTLYDRCSKVARTKLTVDNARKALDKADVAVLKITNDNMAFAGGKGVSDLKIEGCLDRLDTAAVEAPQPQNQQ